MLIITKEWLYAKDAEKYEVRSYEKSGLLGLPVCEFIQKLIDSRDLYYFYCANFMVIRSLSNKGRIKYALFAAESVLWVFEKQYSHDDRIRNVLESVKIWLANPTDSNTFVGRIAAHAAIESCVNAVRYAEAVSNAADAAAAAIDESDTTSSRYDVDDEINAKAYADETAKIAIKIAHDVNIIGADDIDQTSYDTAQDVSAAASAATSVMSLAAAVYANTIPFEVYYSDSDNSYYHHYDKYDNTDGNYYISTADAFSATDGVCSNADKSNLNEKIIQYGIELVKEK